MFKHALSVFGVGLLSLLLYFVVTQGDLLEALLLLGLIVMFACGVVSVILFARAKELGEAATKRQLEPSPTEKTEKSSPTRELLPEGRMEPVRTFTERTTELLFAEKRERQ